MIRLLFLFQLLPCLLMAQQVVIAPQYPQRGQQVTVAWHPGPGQVHTGGTATLVFTYSNLYELPLKIDLRPGDNGVWSTSFVLPRYATFATFYLQADDLKITPPGGGHYELAVYRDDKVPVKSGYLYKAYSLSAQWGRSPHLAEDQARLYRQELAVYPDNYEARVRLYQYEISQAPPAQQDSIRRAANDFIAARFESDPTAMGNLNYVTMGYLILGENSRLDSIRQVVIDRYPHLPIGKELMTDVIRKEEDTSVMVARVEKELKDERAEGEDGYASMHEILFKYYAAHGDSARALLHAKSMLPERSPYLPEVLLDITRILAQSHLAPDAALGYAARTLQLADSFPAGIIRYFPETGYIPSYVPDSMRRIVVSRARGQALALTGMIYADQGKKELALAATDSAMTVSSDGKTLEYAATAFVSMGLYERSYTVYRRLLLQADATDTAIVSAMKNSYRLWKGSATGWEKEYGVLRAERKKRLMDLLRRGQLQAKAPSLDSIVDLSGKAVPPGSLKGKVIVIDFWATWCKPCMEEMPYLQKVYDVYKNDPRVVFMVINSGARNTLQDAQGWFGNKRYSFPVYFHTNPAVGDVFGFNVIPAVFVIDPAGKLQFKTIGFEGAGMEEKLGAEIAVLLVGYVYPANQSIE